MNVVVNKVMNVIICTVCQTVVIAQHVVSHLNGHDRSLDKGTKAALNHHVVSLGIQANLPPLPTNVISAVEGLPVEIAYYCPDCSSCFPARETFRKHYKAHGPFDDTKTQTRGPAQHFNNALGRVYFRVTDNPSSTPAIAAGDPIYQLLNEIDAQQKELVPDVDIRNVSPWLRITKWNEIFIDYDTKSLRSMVALPNDGEFPHLQKAVSFTLEKASGCIDKTTTLVLQMLNSPNPDKEYVFRPPR